MKNPEDFCLKDSAVTVRILRSAQKDSPCDGGKCFGLYSCRSGGSSLTTALPDTDWAGDRRDRHLYRRFVDSTPFEGWSHL